MALTISSVAKADKLFVCSLDAGGADAGAEGAGRVPQVPQDVAGRPGRAEARGERARRRHRRPQEDVHRARQSQREAQGSVAQQPSFTQSVALRRSFDFN